MFKIRRLPERGFARCLGEGIDVVGMEGIAHAVQIVDQRLIAHGKPQASPGQLAGFGEGAHHQNIFIARHQRKRAFRPKIHIRFIHDHHLIGIRFHDFLYFRQRQGLACGSVGISQRHAPVVAPIIPDIHAEILCQGHDLFVQAVQVGPNGIKAVGDIGKYQAVSSKRLESEGQDFVRAVAHGDFIRLQAVGVGQGPHQLSSRQIAVQLQRARRFRHGFLHPRGRRKGAFVGVQLDQVLYPWLLPRHIGLQRLQPRAQISAHTFSPNRIATELAWASSPSRFAKATMESLASSSASLE